MITCLCVGAGGALGAMCRYLLGCIHIDSGGFPLITFCINIAACFIIGFVSGAAQATGFPRGNAMMFLKTGFCGGFSTLSAYAIEIDVLARSGKMGVAAVYAVITIVLCLIMVALGQAAAKILLG